MESDHPSLEKMESTALMLPKENEKVVIISPGNGVGKILIREDTILTGLHGCAGCGRAQFACAGMKKQCSALCWGKQSDKKYYCLLVLLSFSFVLSLLGTILFCFTNAINDAILYNMVLKNNSMAFDMWKNPTVEPLMKVHIFNYTNWERVRDGIDEKLKLDDVGPFVYSQQVERVNVEFEGDKLSYQERNTFQFIPEKSHGAIFEKIFVPNLPLIGVVSKVMDMNLNTFSQLPINSVLQSPFIDHRDAFINLPVHRFLWGYDDTIIKAAKIHLSLNGQLNFDKFGLLVTKNGTVSERLTINTGENDINKMNMIEELDGKSQLPYWGSPDCNRLEGTDGTMFPPSLLDKKTPLEVFFPNLCRRLPFYYETDVQIEDIRLLRYRMPRNAFDDPSHNQANQCYCEIDSGICPPRGVLNVTACTFGSALVSFPHFYLGDPMLRADFEGLNPDPIIHDSYVDIHPTMGISLHGKSALQLNIQVRKSPVFSALGFLKQDLILPVAWLDVTVEELPESIRSLVYHGTYSTAALSLGLSAASIAALICSSICLLIMIIGRRKKPCATLKIPMDLKQNSK